MALQPSSHLTQQRRKPRKLLYNSAFLACLATMIVALGVAGRAASQEEGLKLGSTTYTAEFDPDDSQDEWFEYGSWERPLSLDRRLCILLPFGLLTIESSYEPRESIRKRLPRDVSSLMNRLASRNRYEVKVAAELLAEKKAEAAAAISPLFAAWDSNPDLHLNVEIKVIALSTPTRSVAPLIQALSGKNAIFSAHLLGYFGTNALAAIPHLRAAFETNTVAKAEFASALYKITRDCSSMLPALREILKNGDPREQQLSLAILQEAGAEAAPALPEILAILESPPSSQVTGLALLTFSRVSNDKQKVLETITAALKNTKDAHLTFKSYAIHSLASVGSLGLPLLVSLYTNTPTHHDAGRALIALGPAASLYLDLFVSDLRSADRSRAVLACEIIAALGPDAARAIPALTILLDHNENLVRAQAAAALIRLNQRGEKVLRVFVDALDESGPWPGFGPITLIDLVITDESARRIVVEHLARKPSTAAQLLNRVSTWHDAATGWGLNDLYL